MDKRLLHTPEGVRDIYNSECARKLVMENQIHQVFSIFGYHDIQTPTFEFFDIFAKERGSVESKNMYKFFDREGYTLVLRPDMTPAIARCVAKYYMDEELPVRLCYNGNTFINNSEHQGKLKEITQMGCEYVGDNSVDADAEMIAMAVNCLKASGLKDFQVEIGQVDFFKGLLEEANLSDEMEVRLREYIEIKNFFGASALLDTVEISDELKQAFVKLPDLFGNVEILQEAKTLTKNETALSAIERLLELYEILKEYKVEDYVSFDLGMLSNYQYYTGIIFKGYTYGSGDAVATGGRYDHLLSQFGKNAPAIGFGIVVDSLMVALSRQKIEVPVKANNTMVLYQPEVRKFAVELAEVLRKDGEKVEMICKKADVLVEEYKNYGKRDKCGGILYLENEEDIHIYDLKKGTCQTAKVSVLLGKEEK